MENPNKNQAPYEFNSTENECISDLSKKMGVVAFFHLLSALCVLIYGLSTFEDNGLALVILGGVTFWLGLTTLSGSNAFGRVVKTQGSDIQHLMDALSKVRKLYNFQFYILMLGLALIIAFFAYQKYAQFQD